MLNNNFKEKELLSINEMILQCISLTETQFKEMLKEKGFNEESVTLEDEYRILDFNKIERKVSYINKFEINKSLKYSSILFLMKDNKLEFNDYGQTGW